MTAASGTRSQARRFVWEGTDPRGGRVTGAMRSTDADGVRAALAAQGYTGVRVAALHSEGRAGLLARHAPPPRAGERRKQLAAFTTQLATLLHAGIALSPALALLADGEGKPRAERRLATVLPQVRSDIEAGSSLARALARHPLWFDSLCCAMVDAGEQGGILQDTLMQLARYQDRTVAVQRQIRAALTYPLAVIAIAVAVSTVLLLVVVPAFQGVFAGFGTELPPATRMVIAMSDALPSALPWLVSLPAILLAVARPALRRSSALRLWRDAALLRIPLIGAPLASAAASRWARTLATLALAGTPLVEAMAPAVRSCGNLAWGRACARIEPTVRGGVGVAQAMRDTALFDRISLQMVRIGEESGALEAMLLRIAEAHEERVEAAVTALSRLMEPLLVTVLGVLIGGLVIAMYLPVFSLGEAV
ncbi:type II secretion system F family protein [Paracidovorax citrulli]